MAKLKLDAIDQKILEVLQQDAGLQVSEVAARVGLSQTPCWRRIQWLKEAGVITKNVMLLDPRKINVGVTVFVEIGRAHV